MPLKINEENDLELTDPIDHQFLATWANLGELKLSQITAIVDYAYKEGFNRGSKVLEQIKEIVRKNE